MTRKIIVGVIAPAVLLVGVVVAIVVAWTGTPASDAVKNSPRKQTPHFVPLKADPLCADIWIVGKVLPVTDRPCVTPEGDSAFTSYRTAGDDTVVVYWVEETGLTRWASPHTGWKVEEQDPKYGKRYELDPRYSRAFGIKK